MFKRGDVKESSAGAIATLIAIIALFILVYILLISQEERDVLLYGNESRLRGREGIEGGNVLLSEFVGEISPYQRIENRTHDIASVNLFSSRGSDVITLANNLLITKSLFKPKPKSLFFNLENVKDVNKAELYILVGDKSKGSLVIKLNGREIYSKILSSNSQDIISLPLDYLDESNNIEIGVEGSFLFGGGYELRYVKLRKSYVISNKIAERTFSVPSSEMKDIEKAVLEYSVYCNLKEYNSLRFYLNDNLIYSDVPFCNLRKEGIEIDKDYLRTGVNSFRVESEGEYIVEGLELKTISREGKYPEYYFSLEIDDYKDVKRGVSEVEAIFDFSIKDEKKIMDMYVNENKVRIDTDEDSYYVTISDYIEAEDNLIRIVAKNTFEIIEFRVEVV